MSIANWNPTAFYLIGDYVYDGSGDYYYAVANNHNDPPPSASWVLVTTGTFAPSYASFISSTTQNLTATVELPITNDAKTIGTPDIVPSGAYPTSGMVVNTTGVYKLLYSAQVDKGMGGGTTADLDIYLRVNGGNVPDTATRVVVNNNIETVLTCEYIYSLTAGDVVEFIAYTTGTNVSILAVPSSPPVPAIPSIISNIYRIA